MLKVLLNSNTTLVKVKSKEKSVIDKAKAFKYNTC